MFQDLKNFIPINLLPKKIVEPNYLIGLTKNQLFNKIPKNICLNIGVSDLQAALYPILCNGEAGKFFH